MCFLLDIKVPVQLHSTTWPTNAFFPDQTLASLLVCDFLLKCASQFLTLHFQVEDPSEAVEDMRDKADLATLIRGGDLDGLSAPMNPTVLEITRKKYKFAEVRFHRDVLRTQKRVAQILILIRASLPVVATILPSRRNALPPQSRPQRQS